MAGTTLAFLINNNKYLIVETKLNDFALFICDNFENINLFFISALVFDIQHSYQIFKYPHISVYSTTMMIWIIIQGLHKRLIYPQGG